MSGLVLDPPTTPTGLMELLFLHETRSPGYGRLYDREESLRAMRLMRQVLVNRLKEPAKWGAPGATNEIPIITIKSQFGQFGLYPKLPLKFMEQVYLILELANKPSDPRSAANAQHVRDAITAASETDFQSDIVALQPISWMTAGYSPGRNFRPVATLQGNTFFAAIRS